MRTIWHSLLWKEWHEHKWKLLALGTLASITPLLLLGIFLGIGEDIGGLFPAVSATLGCYMVLAGTFVGMWTAAGENSQRTMPFLKSLPVSMARPASAKLLMASLTIVIPIFIVLSGMYLWYYAWGWLGVDYSLQMRLEASGRAAWWTSNWFLQQALLMSLGTLSLFFWMAAAGVNRSDEVRAGAIGILVCVGVWALLAFYVIWIVGKEAEDAVWFQAVAAALPLGIFTPSRPSWYYLLPGLLSSSLLVLWYVRRFGRVLGSRKWNHSPTDVQQNQAWLAAPRRQPFTALVWQQLRQTGPMLLLSPATVFAIALVVAWQEKLTFESFAEVVLGSSAGIGFLVVLVAGIGVFLEDLQPPLHTFWRSRAANVSQWYWVKYATCLISLVMILGFPAAVFGFLYYSLSDQGPIYTVGFGAIWFGLVFTLLYSLAVAFYCLLRQPIYAAVATITTLVFGVWAFEKLIKPDPSMSPGVAVAFLILAILVTAVTGGWAFKKDLYWRR